MRRYEIYWVDLDPTKGAEVKKVRPCVIISPDELNDFLKTVIVAPLTTTTRSQYRFRLRVKVDGKDGQIAVDQMRVVDKSRLRGRLGELSDKEAEMLRELLSDMFCF